MNQGKCIDIYKSYKENTEESSDYYRSKTKSTMYFYVYINTQITDIVI